MSVIREVYSGLNGAKEQYSVPSSQTIFEQVNAIYDAILGPSRYQEVALLNHVADKLSDEGFAIAVTDPLTAYELLKISAELGEKAQRLDDELVAELSKFFEQEAN